jgi:hypothetical protein
VETVHEHLPRPVTGVLLAAVLLAPLTQAYPNGDISRTFYSQVGAVTVGSPGLGFFGVSDPSSMCALAANGGTTFSGPLWYYENSRAYFNGNGNSVFLPGPGALGPPLACPAPLVIGLPDPAGYQLMVPDLTVDIAATTIHLDALVGTQRAGYTETVTGADWDLGVCPWDQTDLDAQFDAKSGFFPAPVGTRQASCRNWLFVRDANPNLDSGRTTGAVALEKVIPVGTGSAYVISCLTLSISWVDSNGNPGTRIAQSHDYALVVDPTDDVLLETLPALWKHMGPGFGTAFMEGVYDLGGDNGDPCNAVGAPLDIPLLG